MSRVAVSTNGGLITPLWELWAAGTDGLRTLSAEGKGFELLVPQFSSSCARPAFLRRISARLSKELDGFRHTPHFRQGHRNNVTSGPAEVDPVLRAPLPQSHFLGVVQKIVPPFEGAPPHQQILKSAVSASSAEDAANFVAVVR